MPKPLIPMAGDEDTSIPRRIGRVLGMAFGRNRERNPGRVLEYARRQTREEVAERRRARLRRGRALGR